MTFTMPRTVIATKTANEDVKGWSAGAILGRQQSGREAWQLYLDTSDFFAEVEDHTCTHWALLRRCTSEPMGLCNRFVKHASAPPLGP